MTDTSGRARTKAILDGIFAAPPRAVGELRSRLEAAEPAIGRELLLDRIGREGAPPRMTAVIVNALRALGLGEGDVPALAALLLDGGAAVSGRAVALALLSALDAARAQEIVRRLDGNDLMALNDAQLMSVIASIPTTPARVAEVTQKIAQQPKGSRRLRLAQLERIRQRLFIPAALLYHDALGNEELGLDAVLIDILVDEGGAASARLFEARFREARSGADEARFTTALARLHGAGARLPLPGPRGQAWAASRSRAEWDEETFVFSFESAVDGSLTVATLTIASEASGANPMFSGSSGSLCPREELDDLLGSLEAPGPLPCAEAGARVEAMIARGGSEAKPGSMETFAALAYACLARRLA